MSINQDKYRKIIEKLGNKIKLVAVSKTRSAEDISELYELSQRDFGENYVQEIVDKHQSLPKDIRWHFIGHLQSNKVKYIASFVHLIHGVDSFKLLEEINRQGEKNNRVINCLLQIHIATEETKFGINEDELSEIIIKLNSSKDVFKHVKICGLMGMASFTDNMEQVRSEFKSLKFLFDKYSILSVINPLTTLSMGMSADYKIAIEEGSNMVRIGSLIFGERKS